MTKPFKIEPKSFVIKDHSSTVVVQGYLMKHLQIAIDQGKPLVVHIDQKQEDDRTKAQNRLYWMWVTIWAKQKGSTKDDEHLYFRRKFLARIFERDDVSLYRETIAVMLNLKKVLGVSDSQLYEKVANEMADKISTTEANTKQFTEYLNDIYAFCWKEGCALPVPNDLRFAMEY